MNKSKKKVYIMCGAGRFCYDYAAARADKSKDIVISYLELEIRCVGTNINNNNKHNKDNLVNFYFLENIRKACIKYDNIYIDKDIVDIAGRRKVINMIKDIPDIEIIILFFNTSLDFCYQYNNKQKGIYHLEDLELKHLYERIQIPTLSENGYINEIIEIGESQCQTDV